MTGPAESLLGWMKAPSSSRGIRFARPGDAWDSWSYQRLADQSLSVAAALSQAGVCSGDVVTLIQRSSADFVASFFGVLACGATPSPLAPPVVFGDRELYADRIATLVATAGACLVLTDDDLCVRLDRVLSQVALQMSETGRCSPMVCGIKGLAAADVTPFTAEEALRNVVNSGAPALLQFTSGSSGRSRGVRVSYEALAANISAIREWLQMEDEDPTASWLPVHHDMGLIGCMLTPVVNGSDLWLMSPEDFFRAPLRYLACFGRGEARLTAMPAFALNYVTHRANVHDLDGLDFSDWRAVVVGAERIQADALDGFERALAPFGFQRRALLPAYGLAEATLAVSGLPLAEEWSSVRPDPRSLALGNDVRLTDDELPVTGCGRPLKGTRISIVDDDGRDLGEGTVGEISVTGDGVALGYVGHDPLSPSRFSGDQVRTGDAGFLLGGQLFVVGRLGDALKIRGCMLFAEDLEAAVAQAGVPADRLAVLLGELSGRPTAVALIENATVRWWRAVADILALRAEGAAVVLLNVPKGGIVRTTSGKPRRRPLWHSVASDALVTLPPPGPVRASPRAPNLPPSRPG